MPHRPPLNHILALSRGAEEVCPHAKEALELRSSEGPKPRVNCIKSYIGPVGGKERHLSGYLEVAGSTSGGTELHRLIILCANKLYRT